jgi:hypothetical protein
MTNQRVSEERYEAALDQAYLEGVSAAMNEVERKLEEKRQAAAKAKLQEKILQQASYVQQQLDEQERQQMLAMQRMQREQQQLRQQAAQQSEELLVAVEPVSEPKRLPKPKQAVVAQESLKTVAATKSNSPPSPTVAAKTTNKANVNSSQFAAGLKTSVADGVNGMFSSLWGSNQKEQLSSKPQTPKKPRSESATELSVVPPDLPRRPPVSPVPLNYGLAPEDEPGPVILQARFAADYAPIGP